MLDSWQLANPSSKAVEEHPECLGKAAFEQWEVGVNCVTESAERWQQLFSWEASREFQDPRKHKL